MHSMPARSQHKQTVLIVDDDAVVQRALARLLKRADRIVLTVESGQAAEEALAKNQNIDLMLTDIMLPDMNGCDLARRARARHPKLGVLYMSGYQESILKEYGVNDGSSRFIKKPFDPMSVRSSVERAMHDPE